jgi:hypothetical protein
MFFVYKVIIGHYRDFVSSCVPVQSFGSASSAEFRANTPKSKTTFFFWVLVPKTSVSP